MYQINRNFFHNNSDLQCVIKRGLTLAEAQAHCRDPETSSTTCTRPEHIARTKAFGPWFDSYSKEQHHAH